MEDIFNRLAVLATKLDDTNLTKEADVVDGVSKQMLKLVEAQYLGVMRYWFANERCWGNCYRRKRAENQGKAAQEVWMDCWQEYQDGLNDEDKAVAWAKYADVEIEAVPVKVAEILNRKFTTKIAEALEEGGDIGTAVVSTLQAGVYNQLDKLVLCSHEMAKLASAIQDTNPELSTEVAESADHIMKIATVVHLAAQPNYQQMGQNIGGIAGGILGGGAGAAVGGFGGMAAGGVAGYAGGRNLGGRIGNWLAGDLANQQQVFNKALANAVAQDPRLQNADDPKNGRLLSLLCAKLESVRGRYEQVAKNNGNKLLEMELSKAGFPKFVAESWQHMKAQHAQQFGGQQQNGQQGQSQQTTQQQNWGNPSQMNAQQLERHIRQLAEFYSQRFGRRGQTSP